MKVGRSNVAVFSVIDLSIRHEVWLIKNFFDYVGLGQLFGFMQMRSDPLATDSKEHTNRRTRDLNDINRILGQNKPHKDEDMTQHYHISIFEVLMPVMMAENSLIMIEIDILK